MDKMKLAIYAAFVLNRDVSQGEAHRAAGYKSRVQFAAMDNRGDLPTDRIIAACAHWGIDAADALIIMGYMPVPSHDWTPGIPRLRAGSLALAERTAPAPPTRRRGEIDHDYPV